MERWVGRVALVTGASVGIGAAICNALVKEGLIVIGCAREVEKIEEFANEHNPGKLHKIKCDLADESDILKMFEEIQTKYGGLDICINNAGFCANSPLLTGQAREWKNMLEVNVLALCICTREAVKMMRAKGGKEGQIIHIGSICGHKLPDSCMPGFNFYCGTKSMVRTLAEGLKLEVMEENTPENFIRVACISPGLAKTEFLSRCLNPEIAHQIYSSMPCLRPEDVADAVLYILQSPPAVNVNDVLVVPTDMKRQ